MIRAVTHIHTSVSGCMGVGIPVHATLPRFNRVNPFVLICWSGISYCTLLFRSANRQLFLWFTRFRAFEVMTFRRDEFLIYTISPLIDTFHACVSQQCTPDEFLHCSGRTGMSAVFVLPRAVFQLGPWLCHMLLCAPGRFLQAQLFAQHIHLHTHIHSRPLSVRRDKLF